MLYVWCRQKWMKYIIIKQQPMMPKGKTQYNHRYLQEMHCSCHSQYHAELGDPCYYFDQNDKHGCSHCKHYTIEKYRQGLTAKNKNLSLLSTTVALHSFTPSLFCPSHLISSFPQMATLMSPAAYRSFTCVIIGQAFTEKIHTNCN